MRRSFTWLPVLVAACSPRTPPPPEPQAPLASVLWVATTCGPEEDCSGRKVTITPAGGAQAAQGVTGPSGIARFVLRGAPGSEARIVVDAGPGKVADPVTFHYGAKGVLTAVSVALRDAVAPEVSPRPTQPEVPPTQVAAREASGFETNPQPFSTGRGPARPRVESIKDTRGIPRVPYPGTLSSKAFRDVVVFTSHPGSYLYLEDKRVGTVTEAGLLVEKMPVGTHRFVAKMPAEAPEYLPPVSDVREVVKGAGAQVVRLDFSRSSDPFAAMMKRVVEGGSLTPAEVNRLRQVSRDDPRYGDAASVLVTWYERRKMYREALGELAAMAATSRFASDPEVHFHLGKLKTATGDYEGALASLDDMQRYLNQYRAAERTQKTAEMFKLRAQVDQLMWARSRGTKPAYLEQAVRDWKSFLDLAQSESERQKAREEIEKNEARLKQLGSEQ